MVRRHGPGGVQPPAGSKRMVSHRACDAAAGDGDRCRACVGLQFSRVAEPGPFITDLAQHPCAGYVADLGETGQDRRVGVLG